MMATIPESISETLAARSKLPALELTVHIAQQRLIAAREQVGRAQGQVRHAEGHAMPMDRRREALAAAAAELREAERELREAETAVVTAVKARDSTAETARYADIGDNEKTALQAAQAQIRAGLEAAQNRLAGIPNLQDEIAELRRQHGRALAAASMGDTAAAAAAAELARRLSELDDRHFEGHQLRAGLIEWIVQQESELKAVDQALTECRRAELRDEMLECRDQGAELANQIDRLQCDLREVEKRADTIRRQLNTLPR